MRAWRRLIMLASILIVVVAVLSGCWDRREINDTAFVLAMGVSRAPDGQFRVIFELVQPRKMGKAGEGGGGSGGGGGGTSSQSAALLRESTGKTIYSTISRLSVTIGRALDEGHCNILLIHEDILKDGGMAEMLDWLTRYYEIRREKIILACDVDPYQILSASPQLDPTQGLNIYKTLTTPKMDCLPGYESTIRDIMVRQSTLGLHVILGRVTLASQPDGSKAAVFNGIDVLDGDRLVGMLPKNEARFANMILNTSRGSTVVLEVPSSEMAGLLAAPAPGYHGGDTPGPEEAPPVAAPTAIQVSSAKTSIRAHLEGGTPVIDVSVKLSGQILEMGIPADVSSPGVLKKLNEILSQYVAGQIRQTIAMTQTAFPKGCDIFYIGEAIHDRYPAIWHQISDNWDTYYKTLKVNVTVNASIYGTGRAMNPSVPHR